MKQPYLLSIHILRLASRVFTLSMFLLYFTEARSQCTPRSLPFSETWSATSFGTCTPTTGGWVAVTTGANVANAGGVGEEASSIPCSPAECEGGTYPDLNFYGNQCYIETDVLMAYSPPINTSGVSSVTFSFLDYYSSSNTSGANIFMQVLTSTDHVTWHQVWSQQGGMTDIDGSTGVSFTISNSDLNNATTYFAFEASSGELCFLYGWWIDNVNIVPVISPTITGFSPSSGCAGSQTITINGSDLAGATSVKIGGTPVSSITSNTATQIIAVVGSGTTGPVTVVTPNGTATSSTNFTVNTTPATPANILGPATVCGTGATIYSVAPVSGATSYTWTLPGSWSGSSSSDSISAIPGLTGGNITVTANNACGSSTAQTLTVTISSAPATPGTISGPDSVCNNSTNLFAVALVSGATSYTWTLPTGWTGTSTTNSINATQGTGSGTISVTANNSCGSSSAQHLAVSIATAPSSPGSITGPDSSCNGSTNIFSVLPVNGATSYTWTLPGGWGGISANDSIHATSGSTGGNITVTANNSCGSSSVQTMAVLVPPTPATPAAIFGSITACSSTTYLYSVAPVNGATSYTWTIPATWTGSSTTDSITTTARSGGGTITVTANGVCGNSLPQTLIVTADSVPPTPGIISGPDSLCDGSSAFYSLIAVTGATFYTWTLPTGWTGSSNSNTLNTIANTGSGSIMVLAGNVCGQSAAQTKQVVLNPVPSVTFNFTNPVCTNVNPVDTLTGGLPAGGVYSGQGVSGNVFDATTLSLGNYEITYSYTSPFGCIASDSATAIVTICTGLEDNKASQVSIYPNPFNEVIIINTNGNARKGMAVLTDATGREISRMEFGASMTVQMNTGSLSNGAYLLNILVDGKIAMVKKLFRMG